MIWQPREAQAVWDIWDIVRAIGRTLQASGACSSALQRGQFFQDFIPRLQRKERDGKHGEQGGSERTSTGTLPCSRHGHTTSGCHLSNMGTHAPVALERLFQQGPFHLPISDPSTVPAPSRAPRGAGHAPQTRSFLPGARKAPGTTRSWGSGCCSMACPEQEHHLNFQGEGALHKAFQAIKIVSKAPILFPCKTKLTKLH